MKISCSTLFVLCCSLIGAIASAQTSPALPPLPPGPLIQKRAPDFAKWVITTPPAPVSSANPSATNGPQNADYKKFASEVTTTKTGKIMLREFRSPDGRVVPTWCVGGLQITLSGGAAIIQAKIYNFDPTVPTANYVDYSGSDFLGFDWIALTNYAGIKEFAGKKCIFFQETRTNGLGQPVTLSAHVDFATRLPVDLVDDEGLHNYTFNAPPTSELVLPPPVVQLLKNRQRELDSATPRSQTQ